MLLPGCFQGLLILDRAQGIEPSLELVTDLDDPDFGLPMYYTVTLDLSEGEISDGSGNSTGAVRTYQCVKIHHSRILRFIGRELPYMETVAENYWGASELEHIWEELQKRSATSANIAQLVFQANVTTLKMGRFGEHIALVPSTSREGFCRLLSRKTGCGLPMVCSCFPLRTPWRRIPILSGACRRFTSSS